MGGLTRQLNTLSQRETRKVEFRPHHRKRLLLRSILFPLANHFLSIFVPDIVNFFEGWPHTSNFTFSLPEFQKKLTDPDGIYSMFFMSPFSNG
ncbi:hypothetical protein BCR33DRAFT_722147 [Rhizoclosmatium globosum]|uniref:Uncharacterized protein n=1 Tax=Rhizoclosmatium globosum TaxID=329046 RepID=A0A1Y2BNL0_9FUNG|nr:hypothetical protein BCR33DRAFT_722147 [Rhizoclosmatium globosum]|eukprot:ORY36348.1 hypothetical protein BCR33DRAFT_722147 [Rhizoclosmatium globosum]